MSNEVLEIDGVSLRGQGFGAATRTGRYSVPSKRGENLVLAGSSGARFVQNKPFEEGSGTLSLWAIGATTSVVSGPTYGDRTLSSTVNGRRRDFEANIQTLMRLFTRSHRLSVIRAAQPDGSIRKALVEWREWSEPEVQAGGTRAEWSVSYTIPDVWWEDETPRSQSATPGTTVPKTLDLTSFTGMTGVIDDSVITVLGPITNPRVTNPETGQWVQYTGVVPNGGSWVVDSDNFTSTIGGTSVLANTVHSGGYRFMTIGNNFGASDTPRLTLTGTNPGAATNFTVAASRKWAHG